jgi:hypothetical protein
MAVRPGRFDLPDKDQPCIRRPASRIFCKRNLSRAWGIGHQPSPTVCFLPVFMKNAASIGRIEKNGSYFSPICPPASKCRGGVIFNYCQKNRWIGMIWSISIEVPENFSQKHFDSPLSGFFLL